MAKSLDDIFNDEVFHLMDASNRKSAVITDEDRLIESFEEINAFYEQHQRMPSTYAMSEYALYARLREIQNDQAKVSILKPFDRHQLLKDVEVELTSIDDIFESDDLGLLEEEVDASIYEFKHAPKPGSRAEAEYIAQRKPMSEREFKKYDLMFQQVHQELREGKRQLQAFDNAERNLVEGNFYLVDGLLAYLEVSNAEQVLKENISGDRIRLEGRTVTVFENGTVSNLLFRSLAKAIQKNGKSITNVNEDYNRELLKNMGVIEEEDAQSGWVYIAKSKSNHPEIQNLKNLYKIGFSTTPVSERVKNASKTATYLYADVDIIASYQVYNMNVQAFENLIHRFFAEVCLAIDIYNKDGNRAEPREWFVVPLEQINEAIDLLVKGSIVNYKYDVDKQEIVLK